MVEQQPQARLLSSFKHGSGLRITATNGIRTQARPKPPLTRVHRRARTLKNLAAIAKADRPLGDGAEIIDTRRPDSCRSTLPWLVVRQPPEYGASTLRSLIEPHGGNVHDVRGQLISNENMPAIWNCAVTRMPKHFTQRLVFEAPISAGDAFWRSMPIAMPY
ncbi:hypothetical protein NKJ74_32420 [Mesorhizobium sp. M0046]|uniref:hypothetical protein n=1 Tax=Mesorhizobium sp. M0046 TaxID=2956858 RepID=UPI00333BC448